VENDYIDTVKLKEILVKKINEINDVKTEYEENYIEPLIELLEELGLDDIILESDTDIYGNENPVYRIFINYKTNEFMYEEMVDPSVYEYEYGKITPIEYITLTIDYLTQEKERYIEIKESLKNELQKIIEN